MHETTNGEDLCAVALIRNSAVVGHVPRKISAACALFLRRKLPYARMRYKKYARGFYEIRCDSPNRQTQVLAKFSAIRYIVDLCDLKISLSSLSYCW